MKRKRTRTNAACVLALVAMWGALGVLMVKALDHPGEQPISGNEYRAQIAEYAPTQTAAELKVELVEVTEAAPSVVLYDVPLDAELQLHIIAEAKAHGIDPAIIVAMAYRESGYTASAIGDNGDSFGLLQVQPYWHSDRMERLGCPDLLDPFQNVTVAVDYLAECLDRYDGDMAKALTAYNQGSFYETITDYALAVMETAEELKGENE